MLSAMMAAAVMMVSKPRPTPGAFVSQQYGLTLRTPAGGSYCALPEDWVGSDHGTVIFLVAPRRCFGAGYPSSGRGFDGDVPRIEVFYGYDLEDGDQVRPSPPCRAIGRAAFLGQGRKLCRTRHRRDIEVSVEAKYQADEAAKAILTLVTTSGRLQADLARFRTLLGSARTCTATWREDPGGRSFTTGHGAPCPAAARWF